MRRHHLAVALLSLLIFSTPAFSQGGFFSNVTGTVTDTSKALIPGVTVKATAVDTGVVTNTITNDAGAYTFANLQPGKYTLTASLNGFQTKSLTDVSLSQNTSYRYNFELTISAGNTNVAVSVSAESIIAQSSSTVGTVLTEQRVRDLPLIGNNVLNLASVMAGIQNIAGDNVVGGAARENETFAGVRADNISIVRDGIQVQDNRYPNGVFSVTTINPDLVGEIRIILAPVDVEIGRGNGTIQISTRSGTNKLNGSAVWNVRNTTLNPNTWTNNRNQTIPVGSTATVPVATPRDWNNIHQFTASVGGPIIKNKTFFFALFDANTNLSRSLSTLTVPTACARNGIFRYFNGWNNQNLLGGTNTTSATNAQWASVDAKGNPVNPMLSGAPTAGGLPPLWNTSIPYDASLQYISVFGPLASKPTAADCSDAPINPTTLVPNGVSLTAAPGAGGGWDQYRRQLDTTGFISRMMAFYPLPNNFESTGDGLNTAGFRFLRHYRGLDNLFGSGEGTGVRRQINVKIDQNFSATQKANINITYERVTSDDTVAGIPAGTAPGIPGMFGNTNYKRPLVLSSGFTSTLTATLLNEARFGMRREGTNVVAPWDRPEFQTDLNALFPAPVSTPTGEIRVIPQFTNLGFCEPYSGPRPPGSGCIAFTATSQDNTPTYTFADTLSWTLGAHAFKFGAELRLNSSDRFGSAPGTFFGTPTVARPIAGSITGTTMGTSGATDIASNNPAMQFLLGTATTGNANNARSLASYLAASINNVSQAFFLTSADQVDFANITDPAKNHWSDYRDEPLPHTKFIQREFDVFFKDDYKITKNLTLNLGVRWDYFGAPYLDGGVTTSFVGGGGASFGISGRDFTGWMNPGQRAAPSDFIFVGPGSKNPKQGLYPNDLNNFSPGVGFAWQLPFWGEGKTTVRGGYQITYQGGGRFNAYQDAIGATPGSTFNGSPNWSNVYQDLSTFSTAVPVTPPVLPMQPLPLNIRNQTFTAFDPHYVSPYVQNLTLSVTRNISRMATVDLRYVGTLSRKSYGTININTNNFLHNGLFEALNSARAGTETTKTAGDPKDLLNQIFDRINLCAVPVGGTSPCATLPSGQSYGAIGTTTGTGANAIFQTAEFQMRSSTTFQANLANAAYNTIAGTIGGFNYVTTGVNASLPAVPAGTVGAALRINGFPENFVDTNPQFNNMNYMTNYGYSNYHSFQVETTLRPIQGVSTQITYAFSKNLGLGTLTDPTNRAQDYTYVNSNPAQSLRTNGTFELPIGPNKLMMGNSSGWVARLVERWQVALIYNLNSGAPTSITATTMLYGNGVPDIVYPVDFNSLKGVRWGTKSGNFVEGRYFDNNDLFVKVDDPQCSAVTSLQNLNNVVNGVQTRCTLDALAMAVPAGTSGAVDRLFSDGATRPSVIVLQHPQPGKKGNLGNNTVIGLGTFSFDANMGKTFKISESKSVQVRFDGSNILNHPQPATPALSITDANYFGRINGKGNGTRTFQGQLRFSF